MNFNKYYSFIKRMPMTILCTALALSLTVFVAGCGDDDNDSER